MKHLFGWLISLLFIAAPALAAEAVLTAADPLLEARVQAITSELRCLVCQNQTIADSHAELAVDLREQVREMVKRGDSQEQIVAYMTARYGDFVLYRPPVRKTTWLLWFGPLLLLVFSVSMLILHLRRRRNQPAELFDPEVDDNEADASPEKSQ